MKSMIAEHADLGRASAWARRVHAALDGWEIARRGRWSTWEGGELLLEIETAPTGIPCERVSIVATADRIGFLTRTFGLQVPLPGQTLERAVEDVKALTRKWFAGEVVIASYWGEGQWRGSTMVDTRQQEEGLGAAYQSARAHGVIDRLEIQTPFLDNDKIFAVAVNGVVQGGSGVAG